MKVRPQLYKTRTVNKFLWLPKKFGKQWAWLQSYKVTEEYSEYIFAGFVV